MKTTEELFEDLYYQGGMSTNIQEEIKKSIVNQILEELNTLVEKKRWWDNTFEAYLIDDVTLSTLIQSLKLE